MPDPTIETNVPSLNITVDSMPLPPDIAKLVASIRVTEYSSPPNRFSITFSDPDMRLIKAASQPLVEGARIEIHLGYPKKMRRMMVGEISALTFECSNTEGFCVKVEGYDLLHRLTRGTCYRRFDGATEGSSLPDSDIAALIASEMGLIPNVDPTSIITIPRVQQNVSNLTFLNGLARLNNYHLWAEGNKLYFKKNRPSPNQVKLGLGQNLLSFSKGIRIPGLVNEFEVRGWDDNMQEISWTQNCSKDLETISTSGRRLIGLGSGGMSRVSFFNPTLGSEKEVQKYAESLSVQQRQSILKASGSCRGLPDIQPYTRLEIDGLGQLEGKYLVGQVTHSVDSDGYTTAFELTWE